MKRAITLSCLILFGAVLICATTKPVSQSGTQRPAPKYISIRTEDHKQVSATYYPPAVRNAPAVILIPDTRCDGSVFGDFASKLHEAGFAVLAMDLRYKDLIAKVRRGKINVLQSQDTYAPVNYEIKSAIELLGSQKEDNSDRIGLLGESYGSGLALHAGVRYKVKALVLISLSCHDESCRALKDREPIQELLNEFGSRPILFMTTEKDWVGNYKAAEQNRLFSSGLKGQRN